VVGEDARAFADGALAAGMAAEAIEYFDSPEQAGDRLASLLTAGDVALLKASRSVRLEKAWERLRSLVVPAAG
jgi:UDP-N-acetylmuramoyl-tripeptide--D-alanyl-D-alanine ligase